VLQEGKSKKEEGIRRKYWEGRRYNCCREERVGRKKV